MSRASERIVSWVARGTLVRALPFAALIVLASAVSYRYHRLLTDERLRVDHTYAVLERLDTALVAAIDAETGQRGFVLTGDDRYLAPFAAARVSVPRAVAALRTLVADSADQERRIDALEAQFSIKFEELDETVDARRRDGLESARAIVLGDRGRAAMDALRATIGAMRAHEIALLAERSNAIRTTERSLLAITVVCASLSIAARLGLARLSGARAGATRGAART